MKRAIVLSGGGSKGAYQIGVWKALRKLHINYDIVTGTSVGALNSILFVQKDYLKALKLWYNLDSKIIFKDEFDMKKTSKKNILKKYASNVVSGGLDVEALEHTVEEILNVKKFYSSNIDMGIITFKLSKLEPIILTKKEIEPQLLKDYVIASASCYPAFKKKEINGEYYIDGGIYDNLPINLAINMGADEVIAVDLKEIGFKQKVKNKNIPITYISPNNDIGSFLIFEKNSARKAIKFGYNDTLKQYKKLEGNKFTFKKGHLKRNYLIYKDKILNYCNHTFIDKKGNYFEKYLKVAALKRIIKADDDKKLYKEFNKHVEKLGLIFKLEESNIYNIKKYNKLLVDKFKKLDDDINIADDIQKNKLKSLFGNKYMIKYLTNLIINKDKKITTLALLFPNEFIEALYMVLIIK